MRGSFDYTATEVPLSRPSIAIGVFRQDPETLEYELLTNILCIHVQYREGADPSSARFRYDFGDSLADPAEPQRFEEVYPLDATGHHVVNNDDHLIVRAMREDGATTILFDGYAQIPQADVDGSTESVTFTALGTPVREWDTPLGGALMRDADTPATSGADIATNLPARFNPDGHPNASPGELDADGTPTDGVSAKDSGTAPYQYPTFLGPVWPKNEINDEKIRIWTLGMAARYIMTQGNPDQTYVSYSDLTTIDDDLLAITPTADGGPINLGDSSTFDYKSIPVQDYDITGEPWPVALERLLQPHGFAFKFYMEQDSQGDPTWRTVIYRKDDNHHVKSLKLQQAGNRIDPGQTNVGSLHLARDIHEIANTFVLDSAPLRIEASFILAPGFTVSSGDPSSMTDYVEGSPNFTGANVDAYRLFVFDECGEGHWDFASSSISYTPGDFKLLLTKDSKTRKFVKRRRPGRRTLISKDDEGKPFSAKLHVSGTYAGTEPGIWDGSTTDWQEIHGGGWELLHDRLGIRITEKDPNAWATGSPTSGTGSAYKTSGLLNLVEWISNPSSATGLCTTPGITNPYPVFRLTCVIDADQGLNLTAKRRAASPTIFAITRRIDARDRFEKRTVSQYSALADPSDMAPGGTDQDVIDDTKAGQAQADGLRRAHELGVFAGTVTIPRITMAYQIGDKIDAIDGRGISFQSNAAGEQKETPIYPAIVSLSFDLDGKQATTLELNDRRGEPAPEHMQSRYD